MTEPPNHDHTPKVLRIVPQRVDPQQELAEGIAEAVRNAPWLARVMAAEYFALIKEGIETGPAALMVATRYKIS